MVGGGGVVVMGVGVHAHGRVIVVVYGETRTSIVDRFHIRP